MKKYAILIISLLAIISCKDPKKHSSTAHSSRITKSDSIVIKKLFNTVLSEGKCYQWLDELANGIGGRLSGSAEAQKAVEWAEKVLKQQSFDSVWLQPVMVPHWVRGKKEEGYFMDHNKKYNVPICALGGSVATPQKGIKASVIEAKGLKDLEQLGNRVKGKIVFLNEPFSNTLINTFKGYSGCVGQRYSGARIAGKYGALAVIVRSITNSIDDFPHTGSMGYGKTPENKKIPTAAISTKAANLLSEKLKENPNIVFYFKQNCKTLPDAPSFNVIGEIKGSKYPNKYITVGGHLDSWDLGDGAHDDGAGVVQSIEVLRLFKKNNLKPNHTLRVVLFMNEENGLRGGKKYAKEAQRKNEIHIAAIESDSGGHTPRGFSFDMQNKNKNLVAGWKSLLTPYGLHDMEKGHAGADISPLKSEHTLLFGYKPDSQRYFDYHHSENDTFDKVNKRELELGAASMAALAYLLDTYYK